MTQTEKNNLLASHAATLEATAKGLRELIAADAPVVEPPKPEPKPEPPPVIEVPNDLSGKIVKHGEVFDLKGQTYSASKSISVLGRIVNGRINYNGPDHSGALDFPKQANGASAENIIVSGRDYTGVARVWGQNCLLKSCEALPGSGWGVIATDAIGLQILKLVTNQTKRGAIYLGGDGGCDNARIDDCVLKLTDYEALLRINSGKGIVVSDGFFDNIGGKSNKEAVQFRGGEITVRACTFLGSAAYGQQPNGQPLKAIVTLKKCTIYGYNRMEAGSEITFEGGEFVNRPEWKGYKLALAGGGELFSLQGPNALGLPKAICTVRDARLDAAKISGGIKPALINCVDPAGKAVTA